MKNKLIIALLFLGLAIISGVSATDLIVNGTTLTLEGDHIYDNVQVINNGKIVVGTTNILTAAYLNLTAINLYIDNTSAILGNNTSSLITGTGQAGSGTSCDSSGKATGGAGGAYGGASGQGGGYSGTCNAAGTSAGTSYGNNTNLTIYLGSTGASGGAYSGCSASPGGKGGAGIKIYVSNNLTIQGTVDAIGGNAAIAGDYCGGSVDSVGGGAGGGSGGTIILQAKNINISGANITAQGGNGGNGFIRTAIQNVAAGGGGGSGGRIKIVYGESLYNTSASISVSGGAIGLGDHRGGTNTVDTAATAGSTGTIYISQLNSSLEGIYIQNTSTPTYTIKYYTDNSIIINTTYIGFDTNVNTTHYLLLENNTALNTSTYTTRNSRTNFTGLAPGIYRASAISTNGIVNITQLVGTFFIYNNTIGNMSSPRNNSNITGNLTIDFTNVYSTNYTYFNISLPAMTYISYLLNSTQNVNQTIVGNNEYYSATRFKGTTNAGGSVSGEVSTSSYGIKINITNDLYIKSIHISTSSSGFSRMRIYDEEAKQYIYSGSISSFITSQHTLLFKGKVYRIEADSQGAAIQARVNTFADTSNYTDITIEQYTSGGSVNLADAPNNYLIDVINYVTVAELEQNKTHYTNLKNLYDYNLNVGTYYLQVVANDSAGNALRDTRTIFLTSNAEINITANYYGASIGTFTIYWQDKVTNISTQYNSTGGKVVIPIVKNRQYNYTLVDGIHSNTLANYTTSNDTYQNISLAMLANVQINFYDEQKSLINLTYFNFTHPDKFYYTIYCYSPTNYTISQNVSNTTGLGPVNLSVPCTFNKIRVDLTYNNLDGSVTQYYRTLITNTNEAVNLKMFLLDADTTSGLTTYLKPYDLFGVYTITDYTQVIVSEIMPSGTQIINSDWVDGEGKITATLISGGQYIITVMSNTQPIKTIGPYYADTAGTKVLRLFDITVAGDATKQTSIVASTRIPDNDTLIIMQFRDGINSTHDLTMSLYSGDCDDPSTLLNAPVMSASYNNVSLIATNYAVDFTYNVNASKYMNKTSQKIYCSFFLRNDNYGVTHTSATTAVYDTKISFPAQFESQWTLPWIIMFIFIIIALGATARTAAPLSLLVTFMAWLLYGWSWFATGTAPGVAAHAIIGFATIIAIWFNVKRVF